MNQKVLLALGIGIVILFIVIGIVWFNTALNEAQEEQTNTATPQPQVSTVTPTPRPFVDPETDPQTYIGNWSGSAEDNNFDLTLEITQESIIIKWDYTESNAITNEIEGDTTVVTAKYSYSGAQIIEENKYLLADPVFIESNLDEVNFTSDIFRQNYKENLEQSEDDPFLLKVKNQNELVLLAEEDDEQGLNVSRLEE